MEREKIKMKVWKNNCERNIHFKLKEEKKEWEN